jgi:mannan endo-1,4-beta-mannosidase
MNDALEPGPVSPGHTTMPWIERAPAAPYFITEDGRPWTPIGQNDAISWLEFDGLYRRRDPGAVERHLAALAASGVTCLRLMLEYGQHDNRFLERPAGRFRPAMVQLWDDLFAMCERRGLRILLTPFDTFFTWIRWEHHPYNVANGGPCPDRTQILVSAPARAAIKRRLAFATERWGGSPALFAWDLWNEIHPDQGQGVADCFDDFIGDVGPFLRALELSLHGRAHPQTVSIFGPELGWRPHLKQPIFRHPALDFASTHLYEEGTIDDPADTVAPALATGRLVREALAETSDGRPYLDSEHGPIHRFKDHHTTLPEPFDDEYFRHMQWAHFASGGAGGGMRWPNRHPHRLTAGMRRAQRALAGFLPLIDWPRFRRRNLNDEIGLAIPGFAAFACGDERQAVLWLLRTDAVGEDGMVRRDATPAPLGAAVPGLAAGRYRVTPWDTERGEPGAPFTLGHQGGTLRLALPPVRADLAVAITPAGAER